jgi:hypothetical protein
MIRVFVSLHLWINTYRSRRELACDSASWPESLITTMIRLKDISAVNELRCMPLDTQVDMHYTALDNVDIRRRPVYQWCSPRLMPTPFCEPGLTGQGFLMYNALLRLPSLSYAGHVMRL